jgi:hypothetical protein
MISNFYRNNKKTGHISLFDIRDFLSIGIKKIIEMGYAKINIIVNKIINHKYDSNIYARKCTLLDNRQYKILFIAVDDNNKSLFNLLYRMLKKHGSIFDLYAFIVYRTNNSYTNTITKYAIIDDNDIELELLVASIIGEFNPFLKIRKELNAKQFTRVSLRTFNSNIDVSEIAEYYDGYGTKNICDFDIPFIVDCKELAKCISC